MFDRAARQAGISSLSFEDFSSLSQLEALYHSRISLCLDLIFCRALDANVITRIDYDTFDNNFLLRN
jgi:hypothetical protein